MPATTRSFSQEGLATTVTPASRIQPQSRFGVTGTTRFQPARPVEQVDPSARLPQDYPARTPRVGMS